MTNSDGGSASFSQSVSALVTSHGFAHGYEATGHSLSASVVAGEGGRMQTDYDYRAARHRPEPVQAMILKGSQRSGAKPLAVHLLNERDNDHLQPLELRGFVPDQLVGALDETGIAGAARAIMTTDTFPKGAMATVDLPGGQVKIAGIAKGSGMIAPDMATMLVYVFTDARIARADLQAMVSDINARSFNCITVDSDTSTSDTLLMGATGASGVTVPAAATAFPTALEEVFLDLAHQVVRDGEGATKFVEITVKGTKNDEDAQIIARTIGNSLLCKTAFFGQDPNWGRFACAVGYAGVDFDPACLKIAVDNVVLCDNGIVAEYREEDAAAVMQHPEFTLSISMGQGNGSAVFWTSDLSHDYVSINADYRS